MDRTNSKIDTPVTRGDSRPVRYELIDKDGHLVATADKIAHLAEAAVLYLPGQEQDEDRTGKGWDVQVVGCDR